VSGVAGINSVKSVAAGGQRNLSGCLAIGIKQYLGQLLAAVLKDDRAACGGAVYAIHRDRSGGLRVAALVAGLYVQGRLGRNGRRGGCR